jgi:hypothetical protein
MAQLRRAWYCPRGLQTKLDGRRARDTRQAMPGLAEARSSGRSSNASITKGIGLEARTRLVLRTALTFHRLRWRRRTDRGHWTRDRHAHSRRHRVRLPLGNLTTHASEQTSLRTFFGVSAQCLVASPQVSAMAEMLIDAPLTRCRTPSTILFRALPPLFCERIIDEARAGGVEGFFWQRRGTPR